MAPFRSPAFSRDGSGPPLLLLHGLGTTHHDFDRVGPLLADDFDVLALDLPGQGEASPVPGRPTVVALTDAVEAELDAQGIQRTHILGNSLGGRIAIELASRGRARSVVAIAPSGLSLPPERVSQVSAMAATAAAIRVARPVITPLARHRAGRVMLLAGLRARPWLGTTGEAEAMGGGFGSPAVWSLIRWAIGADIPRDLDRIDCPVLLLQGTADAIASGQTARFLPLIRTARFQPLFAAGHAAHGDVPARVAQHVRDNAALAPEDSVRRLPAPAA